MLIKLKNKQRVDIDFKEIKRAASVYITNKENKIEQGFV